MNPPPRVNAPLFLRDREPAPAGAGGGGAPAAAVATGGGGGADSAARPARQARRWRLGAHPELLGLLALAAVLNLWMLSRNGWANDYYAAAVRSMAGSWHAFLYGSFDPSGVMTVDKPPLALWVQALSVRAFGYSSWSILVPQALMGVATVGLVYDLTRRRWGRIAGGIAGLVLATTPIAVAMFRHNNPDALLLLTTTAALWALVRGLEDGRTRWIVLAGACVGLAFETKMGAGLLVVPGMALAWLWVAPRGRIAALRQLLWGGAAMVVVGGAWPALMALTPAADRPWISGTNDNSILSLIFGYNGFGRLTGQAGGPAALGGGGPGGGGGGGVFGGSAGIGRLLDASLGGQAGWLVGFAIVALVGGLAVTRLRRTDARTGWLIAVGGAFVVSAIAFSTAEGIFHPYYVSELAPFLAALVGAGAALILQRDLAARIIGPVAIGAGVLCELVVLSRDDTSVGWVTPLLLILAVPAAVVLAAPIGARARLAVLGVALAALLAAPATWAVETLGHPTEGTFPAGGPQTAGGFGGPGGAPGGRGFQRGPGGGGFAPPSGAPSQGGQSLPFGGRGGFRGGGGGTGGFGGGGGPFGGDSSSLTEAIAYAKANGGGTIAVASQSSAATAIIASDADVAGIGGFSGRESAVSASWLAEMVRAGKIRWVVADGGGGFGGFGRSDGRTGATDVMAIVEQTCTPVTVGSTTLYDCAGKADAITAAATTVPGTQTFS